MPNICICGGGSLGHVCAAFFAAEGNSVSILTGHPQKWSNSISCYDKYGKCYTGKLNKVSSVPQDTIPEADIVLLCLPGYLIEETLEKIKPYLKQGVAVGSVVASTGFFFFAHKILGNTVSLFGFQRVPFIARVRNYGKDADLLGYKPSLNVSIEPAKGEDAVVIRMELEKLLKTPVTLLDSFYEASLTNSNPLLHTSRLYQMWHDYNGESYPEKPLFYVGWNDEASRLLIAMDQEFMQLLDYLGIRKGAIPPIQEYYESPTPEALTKKITSIEAFKGIVAPVKETPNGWVPDFESRYFTEDFPFGLKFIKKLAEGKIKTPNIDCVYEWGLSKIKK